MALGWPQWIVLAVAAQRLVEVAWAQRNTKLLLAQGGREIGAGHYPLFILLHGGWLVALFVLVPADQPVQAIIIALFTILQTARIWVVASLGPYWTTRVITVPGQALVKRGPYRFVRHPNYLIVAGEIALLPLAFGNWPIALLFSIANAILLWHRIGVENSALAERRSL